MRSIIFLIFLIIQIVNISSRTRIYKFNCNSSNQTCSNTSCRLRSISRTNQTISVSCMLQRNVVHPHVSQHFVYHQQKSAHYPFLKVKFHWYYKSGQYWRQIIKLDSMSLCKLFNATSKVPFLDDTMKTFKSLFPTLPSECPVMKGHYHLDNVSNGNYEGISETMRTSYGLDGYGVNVAVGETKYYKVLLSFFSIKDNNIFTVSWESEYKS